MRCWRGAPQDGARTATTAAMKDHPPLVSRGRRSAALLLSALLLDATAHATPQLPTTTSRVSVGCFPQDCSSSIQLGWIPAGLMNTNMKVPKFDGSLGTLVRVDLTLRARQHGVAILDNTNTHCTTVELDLQGTPRLVPHPGNVPALTGLGPLVTSGTTQIIPPGFRLDATDGVQDIVEPRGAPSNGSCTPGADHVVAPFDETLVASFGPLTGADVEPWIGRLPDETVRLRTGYGMLLGGSTPPGIQASVTARGRLQLEAVYTYIPFEVARIYCECSGSTPCGNAGAPGEGCANSTGRGGRLRASGTPKVQHGNLALHADLMPAGVIGVLLESTTESPTASLFGDGQLCLAGTPRRVTTGLTDPMGHVTIGSEALQHPGLAGGGARHYQLWYRDVEGSPCGLGHNGTNALEVDWIP